MQFQTDPMINYNSFESFSIVSIVPVAMREAGIGNQIIGCWLVLLPCRLGDNALWTMLQPYEHVVGVYQKSISLFDM